MNPELLKKLKALLAAQPDAVTRVARKEPERPSITPAEVRRQIYMATMPEVPIEAQLYQVNSPVADSVFAITGVPSAIGGYIVPGAAGQYIDYIPEDIKDAALAMSGTAGDSAYWNKAFSTPKADYMGLTGQAGLSYSTPQRPLTEREVLLHEAGHKFAHRPDQRVPADDLYGPGVSVEDWNKATSRREPQADVFANVFDFLSRTGTPRDTTNWRNRLNETMSGYPDEHMKVGSQKSYADSLAKMFLAHPSKVFRGHPLREAFGLPAEDRVPEFKHPWAQPQRRTMSDLLTPIAPRG